MMNLCEGIVFKIFFSLFCFIKHTSSMSFFYFLTHLIRHTLLKNVVKQIIQKCYSI